MPIATLKFRLPEEARDHLAALNGVDALICLEKIDAWARSREKWGEPNESERRLLENLRGMIPFELLQILE